MERLRAEDVVRRQAVAQQDRVRLELELETEQRLKEQEKLVMQRMEEEKRLATDPKYRAFRQDQTRREEARAQFDRLSKVEAGGADAEARPEDRDAAVAELLDRPGLMRQLSGS